MARIVRAAPASQIPPTKGFEPCIPVVGLEVPHWPVMEFEQFYCAQRGVLLRAAVIDVPDTVALDRPTTAAEFAIDPHDPERVAVPARP